MTRLSFQKLLFGSFFAGAALAPLSAHAQAAKAPELYFYPTQKWSVAQQDGKCVLQNQFNNGFTISFNGTTRWVETLGVNFRQNIFEKDKDYNTTLTVPGIASQNISARAINGEALSLNFRNRKDLYQKIRSSGVLDIKIENNNFRFYLTGLPNSSKQFERCMSGGSIAEPSAKIETAVNTNDADALTPPSGLVASSRDLVSADKINAAAVNETISLEQEIKSSADQARPRLSEQLSQQILNNPDAISFGNEAAPSARPNEKQALAVPPELNKIELVEKVEKQVESAPVIEVVDAEPATIELKAEPVKEALKDKPAAQPEAPEIPETIEWSEVAQSPQKEEIVKDDIEDKVQEIVTPEPVLEESSAPVADIETPPQIVRQSYKSPEVKIHKETKHIEADFTQSGASDAQVDAFLAKISVLEKDLEMLRSENKALNEDLDRSLKSSEKELLSVSSENWNLERATMKFNEAERQIKRLGQQLQAERAKCSVEKKELEAMLFDPQLTQENQLARLANLEEQLAEAQTKLQEQQMRYEQQINVIRAQ